MTAPRPLSTAIRTEVLTACRTALHYRGDLKSLMLGAGVPAAVYNRYDSLENSKVKIARSILDELHEMGTKGWAVQRRIVAELCGMQRPANDVPDVASGRRALDALRRAAAHEGVVIDTEQAPETTGSLGPPSASSTSPSSSRRSTSFVRTLRRWPASQLRLANVRPAAISSKRSSPTCFAPTSWNTRPPPGRPTNRSTVPSTSVVSPTSSKRVGAANHRAQKTSPDSSSRSTENSKAPGAHLHGRL